LHRFGLRHFSPALRVVLELHLPVELVDQGGRLRTKEGRRIIRALAGQVVGAVQQVQRVKLVFPAPAPTAPVAVAAVLATTLSGTRLLRGL
jgi:hypothetical protein